MSFQNESQAEISYSPIPQRKSQGPLRRRFTHLDSPTQLYRKLTVDYHLRVPPRLDLEQVFCLEEERTVSPDWVVQYGTRWLQIERDQKVRIDCGATVMVREHRDGSVSIWLKRTKLRWREIAERPRKASPVPKRRVVVSRSPAREHPWRQAWSAKQQARNGAARIA